ncbi:MAG TPA: alpha/beta hydrolase [Lacunisphaera sp.]|jgi:acetyl esterase/lipase
MLNINPVSKHFGAIAALDAISLSPVNKTSSTFAGIALFALGFALFCPLQLLAGPSMIRPTFSDVKYGALSSSQTLDIYRPVGADHPVPLVIWIHGGGFSVGDKRSMPRTDFGPPPKGAGLYGPFQIQVPDLSALLKEGFAVVSLNYRLGSPIISPHSMADGALDAIRDGKAAVRFLRANSVRYGFDPGRIAVWGNSAGGYMAAILGVTGDQATIFDDPALENERTSSSVQAVVVWFGAEDRLPGDNFKIAHYIPTAKKIPPFSIANGNVDRIISVPQAQRLRDELLKAGAKCSLTILKGAGHEDPAYTSQQMLPTIAFLKEVLSPANTRGKH